MLNWSNLARTRKMLKVLVMVMDPHPPAYNTASWPFICVSLTVYWVNFSFLMYIVMIVPWVPYSSTCLSNLSHPSDVSDPTPTSLGGQSKVCLSDLSAWWLQSFMSPCRRKALIRRNLCHIYIYSCIYIHLNILVILRVYSLPSTGMKVLHAYFT